MSDTIFSAVDAADQAFEAPRHALQARVQKYCAGGEL